MTNEKPIWTVYLFTVKKNVFFLREFLKHLTVVLPVEYTFLSLIQFLLSSRGCPIIGFYPC
jgi:hypothetical protein